MIILLSLIVCNYRPNNELGIGDPLVLLGLEDRCSKKVTIILHDVPRTSQKQDLAKAKRRANCLMQIRGVFGEVRYNNIRNGWPD